MKKINGLLMQYFEWYMASNKSLWVQVKENAEKLAKQGVTALWLPPAYKGYGGIHEVGYGAYDLYDLGEFYQMGTVETKYGSKDDYLNAILALHHAGIEVYADIVLNQKMGGDMVQTIPATKVEWDNHNVESSGEQMVKVSTKFTFPGRNHKYSDFEWNWTHFSGVDYNNETGEHAIFKFKNKNWSEVVDEEKGNFDYLLGANLDFSNPAVVEECINWGKWYVDFTKIDGFRLDAIKHIDAVFYKNWIDKMREINQKNMFAVGEYWSGDLYKLHRYISETEGKISLFDVPLHFNFYSASKDVNYDMSKILEHTLVKENPCLAVTFVDNHDTQPDQSLSSFVEPWFKPIAYSIILLRSEGYPCVFYGDYYGIPHSNIEPIEELKTLMLLRKDKAYGFQHDYFDHDRYIGWTIEGDTSHNNSGLAVIISTAGDGFKRMYIGPQHEGEVFIDAMHNCENEVIIDEEGCGDFSVKGRSVSVWVKKSN